MYRIILPCLLSTLLTPVLGVSATQTDWSGSGSVMGPVLDWGDDWWFIEDCSGTAIPGMLVPLIQDSEHLLDDNHNVMDLHVADIDGDGDNDVIGSGWSLYWWENIDGNAENWIKHTVQNPLYASPSLYCGDMDLDGHPGGGLEPDLAR